MRLACVLVLAASFAATAGDWLVGGDMTLAPSAEIAGQKALVVIPRGLVGYDSALFAVLGSFTGRILKEEGEPWPFALILDTTVGFYWKPVALGPVSLGFGPFISPSLAFHNLQGSQAALSMNFVVGLRLFQLLAELPYSFAGFFTDLHPNLGILPGFMLGVRF